MTVSAGNPSLRFTPCPVSGPTITPPARVVSRSFAYFALCNSDTCSGRASINVLHDRTTRVPSPTTFPPTLSASSATVIAIVSCFQIETPSLSLNAPHCQTLCVLCFVFRVLCSHWHFHPHQPPPQHRQRHLRPAQPHHLPMSRKPKPPPPRPLRKSHANPIRPHRFLRASSVRPSNPRH